MPPAPRRSPAATSQTSPPSLTLSSATSLAPSANVDLGDDDEDEDDEDEDEVIPPLPTFELPAAGCLPETRSREIISDQQRYCGVLNSKLTDAYAKIAALKAEIATTKKRPGPKSKKIADPNAPYDHSDVLRLGKSCAIMLTPFMPPEAFGRPVDLVQMPHPQSRERFANGDSYTLGLIVQLHDFLGSDFFRKLAVESTAFKNEFLAEVGAQRSTALNNIRKSAFLLFAEFNFPATIWSTADAACKLRRDHPTMQTLLAAPPGTPGAAS
ncbi:hypothetical protein V5O48_019254, partial [Marasmius crinis-equi]